MDETLKFTEDKKFVQWVLHPNEELNSFWEDYKQNNPSELKNIEAARIILLQLKSKKEDISATETNLLFSNIQKGIDKANNERSTRHIVINILKYAAIALILISVGIGYKYYQNSSDFLNTAQNLASNQEFQSNHTELVLGNGKVIEIKERSSFIECQADGEVIINNRDTVLTDPGAMKNMNQLMVPRGCNSLIKLADGTLVHINADSRFVYPATFADNVRKTYLAGEGFFEVAHNAEKPFHTQTDRLNIEVLGTKYNVSAYPTEDMSETFLVEGKVSVTKNSDRLAGAHFILKPLEKASYIKSSNNLEVAPVGNKDYVSWYEGYLNFDSKEVSSIIKKVERHYNIRIQLQKPELGKKLISGKLKLTEQDDLTVVQVLANTASLQMDKINDTTYLLK